MGIDHLSVARECRMLLDESMKRLENRADELAGKIGRMDRILGAVVEGSTDCPRLFILTPARGGPTVSVHSQLLSL